VIFTTSSLVFPAVSSTVSTLALATTGQTQTTQGLATDNQTNPNTATNPQTTQPTKTTQLNQLNFQSSIELTDLDTFFSQVATNPQNQLNPQNQTNQNNTQNPTSITLTADLETTNHTIPVTFEFQPNNKQQTLANYQTAKNNLLNSLRITKAEADQNQNKTQKPQKFDKQDILKSMTISTSNSSQTTQTNPQTQNPTQPVPATVTTEELDFYETNGYLPPITLTKDQITKLKQDYPNQTIPHLDPQTKGKFTNARPQDREAILTENQKQERSDKQEEQTIQAEILNQLETTNLNPNTIFQNTDQNSTNPQITTVTYFTTTTDQTAKNLAKESNKPHKDANNLTKQEIRELRKQTQPKKNNKQDKQDKQAKTKADKNNQTNQTKTTKLTNNLKSTITQDITSTFQQTEAEKQQNKQNQEKEKQDYKNRAKTTKQFHSKEEAQMYKQEGIEVETTNPEDQKTLTTNNFLENLLKTTLNQTTIQTQAKGLNNSKNSLIIYNPNQVSVNNQNKYLGFQSDTNNWAQQIKMQVVTGNYSNGGANFQRFCFDNQNNKIYLTGEGTCDTGWQNKMCLHALQGATYSSQVTLINCNWNNGNDDWQKWFFDEEGRIALLTRPDMCMNSQGGMGNGYSIGMWGCNSDTNEVFRAGYNNFGTGMGMSIWAVNQSNNILCGKFKIACSNSYNMPGHAFVELWSNYGTHNTFSRWDFDDGNRPVNSSPNAYLDCTSMGVPYPSGYLRPNNICDKDAISVDVELDLYGGDYGSFRRLGIWLGKADWDRLVFGSGYRNNFMNGVQTDIGGSGTYNTWGTFSHSRNANPTYKAKYGVFDFSNVCSGYAIKLWSAYRGGNKSISAILPYPENITIPAWSPDVIYRQL
jgi:hypothetical protein